MFYTRNSWVISFQPFVIYHTLPTLVKFIGGSILVSENEDKESMFQPLNSEFSLDFLQSLCGTSHMGNFTTMESFQ